MKTTLLHITVALAAMLSLGSCGREEREPGRLFYSEVKSANKLVLSQMTVSKMVTIDDLRLDEAKGMKQTVAALADLLKIGDRKAAYSYDTYLRAYIDLSTLTPEDVRVNERTRTIDLTLPPVMTEYLGRDMEIREEHYRVTGLRSPIDARERAAIKEKMNEVVRREIEEKPAFRDRLAESAKAKARTYFQTLPGAEGYTVNLHFR